MADTTTKRSPRKRKSDQPEEHIIPIIIETDDDESSSKSVSSATAKDVMDQENSSNESICDSVKHMSIEAEVVKSDEHADVEEKGINVPRTMMRMCNVREKIIIVYDCGAYEDSKGFQMNGESFSVNDMIKRCLSLYLSNKSMIDEKHEFALVILKEDAAVWVTDFTNNINTIIAELDNAANCETKESFDLDELFLLITSNVKLPENTNSSSIPPPFIVRVVFVYNRSNSLLTFASKDVMQDLLQSPYFIFDVLLALDAPDASNSSASILKCLTSIDEKGNSYYFSVGHNVLELHVAMAKLLAHPLQRPIQTVTNYMLTAAETCI